MAVNIYKELEKIDFNKKVGSLTDDGTLFLEHEWTIEEATTFLRNFPKRSELRWFYVLDKEKKLKGVISSHNLLLAQSSNKVSDIMDESPISIKAEDSLSHAIHTMNELELLSLPVIDHTGAFLGIFEMQATPEIGKKESLKKKKMIYGDIFQMIGLSVEKADSKGVFSSFSHRIPWLIGNSLAGFACAIIAGLYEHVLQKAIILATLIPLILTLSESVSMQAMTLSLAILKKKEIPWKNLFFRIGEEWKTTLLLSIAAACFVSLASYFFLGSRLPYLVVFATIILSMFIAATFAVLAPIIVHKLKLDPKIASGPIVLVFADIMTTFVYLYLASIWLL